MGGRGGARSQGDEVGGDGDIPVTPYLLLQPQKTN